MATLVRWQPWTELAGLQNDMSRLMNGLLEGNGKSVQSWVPALDVWETENELVYAFDLPGIPEEQISVEVEDGSLSVTAERSRTNEQSDDRFYRFERRHGTFTRTIGLPQDVSEDAINAEYKNGVLEIHVVKPEQAKPRRIQIAAARSRRSRAKQARSKPLAHATPMGGPRASHRRKIRRDAALALDFRACGRRRIRGRRLRRRDEGGRVRGRGG